MTMALAQPARSGNPGIVPPWLQGPRPVTPAPTVPTAPTPVPAPESTRDVLTRVRIPGVGDVIVDLPVGVVPSHDHSHSTGTSRQGRGAASGARDGARIAAEQQRIDSSVQRIQQRFSDLGISAAEGNGPVKAYFRPEFDNAAYAPDGLAEFDLPRDSIGVGVDPRSNQSFAEAEDVVAHELAHRVIDHMTPGSRPLSMDPRSEDVAIHESLADTFAALVDTDDWTLGEDLVQPVRIMDQPERLGHPGHMRDLERVFAPGSDHLVPIGRSQRTGKVVHAPDWHVVAGIPNKAAALIGDRLGRDTLAEIYLKAVRENVRPGGKIEGLAAAVMTSAKDLFGANSREFEATVHAWDAVGVIDSMRAQARR